MAAARSLAVLLAVGSCVSVDADEPTLTTTQEKNGGGVRRSLGRGGAPVGRRTPIAVAEPVALQWETESDAEAADSATTFEFMRKFKAQAAASAEGEVGLALGDDVPAGSDFDQPSLGAYCIPTPDSSCWPSKDAWRSELHDMLSENATSILPYHIGFSTANVMRNAQMASYPASIINAATVEDVQACLAFAHKYGIRVTVKTTGHDYDGRSNGDGSLNINLANMNWAQMVGDGSHQIRVGPGCSWNDVYVEGAKYGLAPVSGYDHTVGVSGLTLGGGHGAMSRLHGLAVDQLVSATVVTADGLRVLVANDTSNEDLFFALRGGGAGFGVVVEWQFQLHPTPPFVTEILYSFPLRLYYSNGSLVDAGKEVLRTFMHNASFWEELPNGWGGWRSLDTSSGYSALNREGYLGQMSGSLVYVGGDAAEASELVTRLNAFQPAWRNDYNTFMMTLEYESLLDYVENGTTAAGSYYRQFIGNIFAGRDELKDESITDSVVDSLVNIAYQGGSMNYFTNDVLGGKINDPDALETTAVSAQFRRALIEIGPNQGWIDPAYDSYYNALSSTLAAQLYALSNGSYVNEWSSIPRSYNDFDDWKYRFWGDKYDDLLAIKKKYDPCNFLSVKKSVGSDEPINTCWQRSQAN